MTSKVPHLPFRGVRALAIVVALSSIFPVVTTSGAAGLLASDGGVINYGDATFYGSTASLALNKPIVGMAATPDGKGYTEVASDGGIFTFGDATFYGSTGSLALNKPIVGMAATPDGKGYWLVAGDGGIFAYGDANFYGSTGSISLNQSVVGMAATPTGKGYWLVARDGGIFAYGDAQFYGSTGSIRLNQPVVGMAATPTGDGYWLGASDGGIFSYGGAAFYGSTGSLALNKPVVGVAATPDGKGYSLVASDGGVFTYGDAVFYGSSGGQPLNRNIVGMAVTPDGKGYWLVASNAGLAAPAGFTAQQLIFDDQFSGTSLDTSKWTTSLGAEGILWDNFGHLPAPYTGPNTPVTTEAAMFGPSQVTVNNGLTLTAQRNTNRYSGTYPWISGVVTTEGKFSLPAGSWYVQVRAKMPDQSQGMWPAIWFLPGVSGTPVNEFDGDEGGVLGPNPNQSGHSDYFANQGAQAGAWNAGADVTAGYHVYGFQFIPGQSITAFLDGRQVWQVQASSGITITGEPYEIILQLEVASQQTAGWHTVTTGGTPSASMEVAEVQAYS